MLLKTLFWEESIGFTRFPEVAQKGLWRPILTIYSIVQSLFRSSFLEVIFLKLIFISFQLCGFGTSLKNAFFLIQATMLTNIFYSSLHEKEIKLKFPVGIFLPLLKWLECCSLQWEGHYFLKNKFNILPKWTLKWDSKASNLILDLFPCLIIYWEKIWWSKRSNKS